MIRKGLGLVYNSKRKVGEEMKCPCCGVEVREEHFACRSGSKGGKAGIGEKKARTSEQARVAVEARWRKRELVGGSVVEVIGKLSKGGGEV